MLGLALVGSPVTASPSSRVDRAIRVQLDPGPYFVGQAISLEVIANRMSGEEVAGPVESPRILQADLIEVKADRTATKPEILSRFTLVPRRAGGLAIPPFRVRSGERVAVSTPLLVNVANLPPGGRTRAFLGGVGAFQVTCQVEPKSVRVGEPVEFQIAMTGPAAVGSNLAPDLASWSKLAPALQIRDPSSQLDPTDPPTRTFRYRLRPMKPGQMVLPPVALAAFDLPSRGYTTRYTPSLTLTVANLPRFDPTQVDFGPLPERTGNEFGSRITLALALAVTLVGLILVGLGWPALRRWRKRSWTIRPVDWRREATRLAELIRAKGEPAEIAERVASRFARAIAAATKKPVAVLTPQEAMLAILAITKDQALSEQAARLVAKLDEVRFDPEAKATFGDVSFVTEAVGVFQEVGRRTDRPDRFRIVRRSR